MSETKFQAIQAMVALIIPKNTVWWVCTDDLHSKKDSSPEESVRFNPLHSSVDPWYHFVSLMHALVIYMRPCSWQHQPFPAGCPVGRKAERKHLVPDGKQQ